MTQHWTERILTASKERIGAHPMFINVYLLTKFLSIIHVLWYDTWQEKCLFIIKVIDKSFKIKSKWCRGGGLNLCPLIACVFPELEIVKVQSPYLSATRLYNEAIFIRGIACKTVRWCNFSNLDVVWGSWYVSLNIYFFENLTPFHFENMNRGVVLPLAIWLCYPSYLKNS